MLFSVCLTFIFASRRPLCVNQVVPFLAAVIFPSPFWTVARFSVKIEKNQWLSERVDHL